MPRENWPKPSSRPRLIALDTEQKPDPEPEEVVPKRSCRKKNKKKKAFKKWKALECVLCYIRYSREDVRSGLYNLETFICSYCYMLMQRKPHSASCFGKPTFIMPDGKYLAGYEEDAIECSRHCPDRNICRRIVMPVSGIVDT